MEIALIQFKEVGKKYFFKIPQNIELELEDKVVVDTIVGLEIGTVYNVKTETEVDVIKTLKPILRKATEDDLRTFEENEELSKEVNTQTKQIVKELDLNMIVLDSEYTLNRDKLTVYFKADERVDFRELVRRLNSIYRTRIELRQIGPRDVAKMVGGIGPCGLVLCCQTFIGEFESVTIRMAKNQELSLSPRNISGVCGKLLCCLKYEDEVYEELKLVMPDLREKVETEKGKGQVVDINFVSNKVKVKYFDTDLGQEWIKYQLLKNY